MVLRRIKRILRRWFNLSGEDKFGLVLCTVVFGGLYILFPVLTVFLADAWAPSAGIYGLTATILFLIWIGPKINALYNKVQRWSYSPEK